jgi:hypothetical protein
MQAPQRNIGSLQPVAANQNTSRNEERDEGTYLRHGRENPDFGGDSRGTDRLQPFLAVYRLGKQLNSGFFVIRVEAVAFVSGIRRQAA